jgi:hypothetical protein
VSSIFLRYTFIFTQISQVTRKKVTLPPEKEHSIIPDFVSEAIQRSAERSKQQLEKEFKERKIAGHVVIFRSFFPLSMASTTLALRLIYYYI